MAAVGTKFYIEMNSSTKGKRTVSVSNPQDSITMEQVNAFVSAYDELDVTDSMSLGTCYYQDVENRPING